MRVCRLDALFILLDLRHGRYLGLGAEQSRDLAGWVQDWPSDEQASPPEPPCDVPSAFVTRLLDRGMLTTETPPQTTRVRLPAACHSLDTRDLSTELQVGPGRVARFVRATVSATLWLRCRSLQAIATHLEQARGSRSGARARGASSSLNGQTAMAVAVATFDMLRPLAFTSRDRCLFDSLALMNLLHLDGLDARWVIGVKDRPFAAHAWVQQDDLVLNDLHEHVRRFTPILIV
jgi:hypothetical protein